MVARSRQKVVEFIRTCVERAEQGDDTTLEITKHFRQRMQQRGLFWGDIKTVLLGPEKVELQGTDDQGRQQVWVFGKIRNIGNMRIVCSIQWDTRLITLNWEQP